MSRTRKGSKPCGMEFWGRYRCNKYGAAGVGEYAKYKSDIERRMDTKELTLQERVLEEIHEESIAGAFPIQMDTRTIYASKPWEPKK